MRHLDLIRILDESQNQAVRGKTEIMVVECNRILGECHRRKKTLNKILEESRAWDKLRNSLNIWLTDVQERFVIAQTVDPDLWSNQPKVITDWVEIERNIVNPLSKFKGARLVRAFTFVMFCRIIEGSKVDAANEETLRQELKEIQEVAGTIDEMKAKMDELNKRGNALLDRYRADEGHNLSHATSKLNTLWSKFNDK